MHKKLFRKYFLEKSDDSLVQFFRYLFVGGSAAAIDMGVFYVCTNILKTHYILAQTAGFLIGLIYNYFLSILWIFKSSGNLKKEFSLIFFIGFGGLILSYFFLWIFIDIFQITHFQNMLAKIMTTGLVLFWNFFMRKKFAFQQQFNLVTNTNES